MTTVAYEAYRRRQDTLAVEQPACGLRWELLAAIGKTESNHGGGRLDALGATRSRHHRHPDRPRHRWRRCSTATRAATTPSARCSSSRRRGRWGTDGDGDGDGRPQQRLRRDTAAGRYLCPPPAT